MPQQPFKRNDVARSYTTGNNKRKGFVGNQPYCNKCKLHHAGPCTMKCLNCKKVGHMARDCKNQAATNNQRAPVSNQRTLMVSQRAPGMSVEDKAISVMTAQSRGEVNKDSNVVMGTFLLNNCYASMLFDSGADRSFVSTTFSSLMDVVPTVLDDS
ncbi:putative reverse transcriptase domain-containing protein [Tanacetum coccineum]